MKRKWYVVTPTGLPVFGPASKVVCCAYLSQALAKGSELGFLRLVEVIT